MPVDLTIVESTTELGQTVVEVVLEGASEPGPAGPGVPTGGTDGQVLTKTSATDFATAWEDPTGGGGGAPDDATYLVTAAHADLSAEVVVGATPGGELGGTWASPTVDASHSGSTHAAVQAAAEATAAAALSSHEGDTTSIHGIADTSALALTANHPSNATFNDHSARHENGGADEISIAGLDGTPTELTNHLNDTAAAHVASAISADSTTLVGIGTDVQAVLEELDNGIADHLADTADAHDATAISLADAGGNTDETEVEGAIAELYGLVGSGGTEHIIVRKTADESVTSSTTIQDDNELLFAIGANEIWTVTFLLYVDGATGGDIKTAVKGPTGSAGRFGTRGPGSGATTFDNGSVRNEADTVVSDTPVAVQSGTFGAGNAAVVQVDALVVNGSTAGNVVLQWAQAASSATATRVLTNSYLIAHRIA